MDTGDLKSRLADGVTYAYMPYSVRMTLAEAADRIEALETTLRQIADSGNSINAHLAAQALKDEA